MLPQRKSLNDSARDALVPNTPGACCCHGKGHEPPRASRAHSRNFWECAGGAASIGVWVLMPKCPVCLAAYVALWTGLGLSFATAQYVRWSLLLLSATALLYLVGKRIAKRSTRQLTLTARQAR
jgi:hypothetical protein